MLTNEFRIAKVRRTLNYFENDIALLNMYGTVEETGRGDALRARRLKF